MDFGGVVVVVVYELGIFLVMIKFISGELMEELLDFFEFCEDVVFIR